MVKYVVKRGFLEELHRNRRATKILVNELGSSKYGTWSPMPNYQCGVCGSVHYYKEDLDECLH